MPRKKNYILHELFERDNDGNRTVCNNGNCDGRLLSSHSANLERHLKHVHPSVYEDYLRQKSGKFKTGTQISMQLKAVKHQHHHQQQQQQQQLAEKLNLANLELAVVEFFTKNGEAWSMIEERPFKILVEPAFKAIGIEVEEENINNLIFKFCMKWKQQTIADVKAKLLSLKIDAVSNHDVNVLCVSVQYMNESSKQVQFKMLAVTEVKHMQTTEQIQSFVLQVLREYEIDIEQIYTITTDSGVQMTRAATDETSSSIDFQMSVDGGGAMESGGEEDNNTNTTATAEELSYDCKLMQEKMKMLMSKFCNEAVTGVPFGGKSMEFCAQYVTTHSDVQSKLENFNKLAKSVKAQRNLCNNKQNCEESWSSSFEALESLLESKHSFDTPNPDTDSLTEEHWNFLRDFTEILRPIHRALIKLQTEKLFISDLYIIIMDLLFKIESQPQGLLKRLLVAALEFQRDHLSEKDLFIAAIYLDPRIKICLSEEQKERAKCYISGLYKRIGCLKGIKSDVVENQTIKEEPLEMSALEETPSKVKSFSEFLNNLDPCNSQSSMPSIYLDLEPDFRMYDRQPRLPLALNLSDHWLRQNNCLSIIANMIMAVPTAQESMGRLIRGLKKMSADHHNLFATDLNWEQNLLVNINGVFHYEDE